MQAWEGDGVAAASLEGQAARAREAVAEAAMELEVRSRLAAADGAGGRLGEALEATRMRLHRVASSLADLEQAAGRAGAASGLRSRLGAAAAALNRSASGDTAGAAGGAASGGSAASSGGADDLGGEGAADRRPSPMGVRIIQAQEEERRRLARDIHDGPAQLLANVVFRIDVSQKLLAMDTERARAELDQLKELVRASLQDVRRIIFDLRPLALDDLGLVAALQSYLNGFGEKTHLPWDLQVGGKDRRLSPAVEVAAFRLVQEALQNAHKHARASRVDVRIDFLPAVVRTAVRDDGAGFDPSEILSGRGAARFGLISMRERAELLGGRLEVESAPERGTCITATLPAGDDPVPAAPAGERP